MAGEVTITITGNLVADPELRFTPSGDAVANFTVASTPRVFKDNAWTDGDPMFLKVAAWRKMGENVAESFQKGDRVIVVGKLKPHTWTTKEGQKRTDLVMDADEVGGSVLFKPVGGAVTSASVNRAGADKANDTWGGDVSGGYLENDPPF